MAKKARKPARKSTEAPSSDDTGTPPDDSHQTISDEGKRESATPPSSPSLPLPSIFDAGSMLPTMTELGLPNLAAIAGISPGVLGSLAPVGSYLGLAQELSGLYGSEGLAKISGLSLPPGTLAALSGIDFTKIAGTPQSVLTAVAQDAAQYPSLSQRSDFEDEDPADSPYSDEFRSPSSFFEHYEGEIESLNDLHGAISKLVDKTGGLPLVWRGQSNADWGLHSQLFRQLMRVNGVELPNSDRENAQPYPDEDQMVRAEQEILHQARADWRFDDMPALELFARIQHAGGPTRLLDVTRNPYIAAWFAVEANTKEDHSDSRLFALATRTAKKASEEAPLDPILVLDDLGAARDPYWHLYLNNAIRRTNEWGTGARRRTWVPPAYDPRISAQNAAFILDGVPLSLPESASYLKRPTGGYWRRADLLASASIFTQMKSTTRKPVPSRIAPTFSFRIKAAAKRTIRKDLEAVFGYRLSYIYPDISGLARHLGSEDLATLDP
jgi:hypothetical protein